jgi:hypothetical protein
MKYYLLLICILGCCILSKAQAVVDIEIVDGNLNAFANIEVVIKESTSQATMKAKTNAAGKVHFTITSGRRWNIYVAGYWYETHVIYLCENESSTQQFLITHSPVLNNRLKQQSFNRKQFELIQMASVVMPKQPAAGFFLAQLTVTNSAGQKLSGKTINIVQLAQKRMYTAVTNSNGIAVFHLPNNKTYDIDVEEHLNAAFMDVGNIENTTNYKTIVYDTYDMVEINKNDTIIQRINLPVEKKNSRAYYSIKINKQEGDEANENVFLDDIESNTVYKAMTDENGEAIFILPFGKKFLIHFNYQRDVDVIDLSEARGKAEGLLELVYTPDPALEHPETFIPTTAKLFLTDFDYYHTTPYPNPIDKNKLGLFLRWGNPTVTAKTKTAVLELGLTTKFITGVHRLPLNASFVIDKSGSMAGYERIESLKAGFIQLIEKLQPNDIISIILFSDEMDVLFPAQRLGNNKQQIIALIQSIQPQGGTNMLAAMKAGYEQVMKYWRKEATNMVVLLTDGYDTNEADTLLQAQQLYNGKITCTGIGVGNDYNYTLLRQLVTKGTGLFNFAGEGKELIDLFANQLITLAAPVAKDISVEILYNNTIRCSALYGFNQVTITAGKATGTIADLYIQAEEPLLAQFELMNPKAATAQPVTVKISYTNTLSGQKETIIQQTTLQWSNTSTSNSLLLDEEQRKMYAVAFANSCLLKMADAFENNKTVEATDALTKAMQLLQSLYPDNADTTINELIEKIKRYQTAFKNIAYKKKLKG